MQSPSTLAILEHWATDMLWVLCESWINIFPTPQKRVKGRWGCSIPQNKDIGVHFLNRLSYMWESLIKTLIHKYQYLGIVCVYTSIHIHCSACMEVSGQLTDVGCLLPACGFQGWNLGHHVGSKALSLPGPSHQPNTQVFHKTLLVGKLILEQDDCFHF